MDSFRHFIEYDITPVAGQTGSSFDPAGVKKINNAMNTQYIPQMSAPDKAKMDAWYSDKPMSGEFWQQVKASGYNTSKLAEIIKKFSQNPAVTKQINAMPPTTQPSPNQANQQQQQPYGPPQARQGANIL